MYSLIGHVGASQPSHTTGAKLLHHMCLGAAVTIISISLSQVTSCVCAKLSWACVVEKAEGTRHITESAIVKHRCACQDVAPYNRNMSGSIMQGRMPKMETVTGLRNVITHSDRTIHAYTGIVQWCR